MINVNINQTQNHTYKDALKKFHRHNGLVSKSIPTGSPEQVGELSPKGSMMSQSSYSNAAVSRGASHLSHHLFMFRTIFPVSQKPINPFFSRLCLQLSFFCI